MAREVDVIDALSIIPERKRSLSKTFSVLESQRNSLIRRLHDWKQLDDHFTDVEKALRRKYEELVDKEKAFQAKKLDIHTVMEKKEAAIAEAEQASLGRVQQQKDAAIAIILEHKRKWAEERQHLEREYGISASKTLAPVDSPALDSNLPAVQPSGGPASPTKIVEVEMEDAFFASDTGVGEAIEAHNVVEDEVNPQPELLAFCENSDGIGLKKFIVDNRMGATAIRAELSKALKRSADPVLMIFNALEGFHPRDKKDPTVAANQRACLLLLEALANLLPGLGNPPVSAGIKQEAKIMADKWKPKNNHSFDSMPGLDVQVFLQIVSTFGLASEYDESDLLKLIASISRRKQTPPICRALGLAHKIPDAVEQLIRDGKHIEAVYLVNGFSLCDHFEPVLLLKSYLEESERAAQAALKSGNNSAKAQKSATNKELSALKSVLKCIAEYKLEAQYPPADLEKRVAELEKAKESMKKTTEAEKSKGAENKTAELENSKEDKKTTSALEKSKEDDKKITAELEKSNKGKKRSSVSATSPAKKPRTSASNAVTPVSSEKAFQHPIDRAPVGGIAGASSLGMPRPGYDRPFQAGYSSRFIAGSGSHTSVPMPYLAGSTLYGSAAYMNAPSAYGGHPYGAGIPPYPGPYLR